MLINIFVIPKIRWMHDFHHKYVETTPTIGNAVSVAEYQVAYIFTIFNW